MNWHHLLLLILFYISGTLLPSHGDNTFSKTPGVIIVEGPSTVAGRLNFPIILYFGPKASNNEQWNPNSTYRITTDSINESILLQEGVFNPYDQPTPLKVVLSNVSLSNYSGYASGSFSIFVHLDNLLISPKSGEKSSHDSEFTAFAIPSWLSILPSLITVIFAISLRQTILALFFGVWLGSTFLNKYNPILGLFRGLDTIIIEGICDVDHVSVIYFCLVIGGMIAVIGKGGGAAGMANVLKRYASTRKKSLLATWAIGVITFFDDYASCLISGSTMRESTGALNISSEKLSFIVDTCAATVSSLMIVSSWIGFELTNIDTELGKIKNSTERIFQSNSYEVFLNTIPYRSYPLLVLFFSLMIIILNRDFGPMLSAERRSIRTGKLVRDEGKPLTGAPGEGDYLNPKPGKPTRWFNAIIPFVLVVLIVVGGMIWEGYYKTAEQEARLDIEIKYAELNELDQLKDSLKEEKNAITYNLQSFFSKGSSFHGLIWASFIGSAVAILLVISQNILTLTEAMDSWIAGTKTMLVAILILMHAWALSSTCKKLYTSQFIASGLAGKVNSGFLPTIVFVMAAIVSFSTGSAWGTMALLFPLMVPLSNELAPGSWLIMLGTISSILSGAVWGNHTSPVSDSCIMSSTSCGSDHTDHVKTQAVYALIVGIISIITCTLPVGFGLYPSWVGLIIGVLVILLLLLAIGRHPEDPEDCEMPFKLLLNRYAPWICDSFSYIGNKFQSILPKRVRIWYINRRLENVNRASAALDEYNSEDIKHKHSQNDTHPDVLLEEGDDHKNDKNLELNSY